ncbi:hypothetical protein LRS73_19355 [Methylobacterium currus]|uniref:hypothetical protein n=1 Tax=Methylobacterium currus TaxID=2051553 RepID=UPI001E470AD1|nr:hypothetical protein [Methylobacterium currus]UHC14686.1 hypothetical protein LRS73_19355 [Methylobacterium currus]
MANRFSTKRLSARRVIDWAGIAAAYRAEPEAGPAIARRFGISPTTLRRRARAEGWKRETPAFLPGVAPSEMAPSGDGPMSKAPSGEMLPGDVLGGHRIVVAQGAALTLHLLDELQAATAEAAPDDGAEEGGLARAAILHKRVAALRDLAAAARLWIALERQAWDLDGKADGKGDARHRDETAIPDPEAAFRLLDEGQRAQLRAIAERLSQAGRVSDAGSLARQPTGPDPGPRPAR